MEHEVTLDVAQGLLPAAHVCRKPVSPAGLRTREPHGAAPALLLLLLRHRNPAPERAALLGGLWETYSSWLGPEQSESIN